MSKKKRRILFIGALVGAIGASLFFMSWQSRSRLIWKGQPAEYWISRLTHFDVESTGASAEEFLFAAGPEVVSALIKALGRRDSWLADRWYDAYFKLGKWQKHFQLPTKRSHYRANAAIGLGLLGKAASNAVPALLATLKDPDLYIRAKAAEALGRIGAQKERVVPELIAGLPSTNANYRLACVIGLTHCLPGNQQAGKALRDILKDPDSNLRAWAAEALWRDDSDREATLAALIEALGDTSASVRDRAARSLGKVDYEPARCAEALRLSLERERQAGKNAVVVWKILTSLGEIGPPAHDAAPALTGLLNDANSHTRVLALIALGRIEPDRVEWTEKLIEQLDEIKEGSALWAAWELGKRGERARAAVPQLLALVKAARESGRWGIEAMAAAAAWRLDPTVLNPIHSITNNLLVPQGGRYEPIRLLGELGAAARSAIPTLKRLRFSHGIMMHDYANDALGKIDPDYLVNPWKD